MERACLFCNDDEAKITVEHTLSEPIRRLLPDRGSFTVDYVSVKDGALIARPSYETEVLSYERHAYCEGCNNGWMQQMDNDISGLLAPLVAGREVRISPTQQLALATWSTKIALVYESLSGASKAVPDSTYHWFHKHRRPLTDMPTQLAEWLGEERHAHIRRLIERRDPRGNLLGVEMVVMTLVIDHYISQTVLPVEPIGIAIPHDGSDRVTIWPPVLQPVRWPPRESVDGATLLAFSNLLP